MTLLVGDLPSTTDVLVIGTGFGGSVMASRLAEGGRDVCVLERGKAYPPGSFPRSPTGVGLNFWDPSAGLHGLFNAWSFSGIDAVVSSGLGGGSLIYANVLLRMDRSWFRQPHPYEPGVLEDWPISYDDLEPHYQRVEDFLDVQQLPFAEPGFGLAKTAAMQHASGGRGFALAPLAVRFRDRAGRAVVGAELPPATYPNIHGSWRRTCRLCGECDVGCNEGAKSTLDHTYLSAASEAGASIHVQSEVRSLARRDDGRFDVGVVVHRPEQDNRSGRALPVHTITAREVILSAGTLGSTYLMLASRDALGVSSPALGTRFCGNGDMLGFVLRADRELSGSVGPVITSYIRYADQVDTDDGRDRGMYLEDAGYPAFAAWLAEVTQGGRLAGRLTKLLAQRAVARVTGARRTDLSADVSTLLGPGAFTRDALPLLGMGRDVPDGTLYLRDPDAAHPVMDSTWTVETSRIYYDLMRTRMDDLAGTLGGRFVVNPTYRLRRVVTVHPVGGCPMGTSSRTGVVDARGRVHGVPGLRVVDGSVLPGPVGGNPALTIAAFADLVADDVLSPA